MLIKITTVLFDPNVAEYVGAYIAYINPDKIVDVQPNSNTSAFIIDMGADCRHSVSADEWKRIAPLLTGESDDTDAYMLGRRHGYDKGFADGADWQKEQTTQSATSDDIAPEISATWETVEDLMQSPQMKALIQAGKRIDAITLYRRTHSNFKEAKTIVNVAMEYVKTAPVPSSALPESVLTAYWAVSEEMDKGPNLDEDELNNAYMNLFDAIGLYLDAQPEQTQAPALPPELINAWEDYEKASWGNLVSLEADGSLRSRGDDLRAMFLTLFSDFIKAGDK